MILTSVLSHPLLFQYNATFLLSSCALNSELTCDLQHSLHHFYTYPHSATSKSRLKIFYSNCFGSFYRYGHNLGRFWIDLSCHQPSLSVNTSRTFRILPSNKRCTQARRCTSPCSPLIQQDSLSAPLSGGCFILISF
jgi:hypothetical protein